MTSPPDASPDAQRSPGAPEQDSWAQVGREQGVSRYLEAIRAGRWLIVTTLVVCLAGGMAGWFLTDGGAHGQPRDGLRVGALAWLMGHGSGVRVDAVAVTAVPLGVTLLCAWATWRGRS